jgi:hypothetical protein
MLEIAISLIVGFVLGFGFRGWTFRQSRTKTTASFLMRVAEVILEEMDKDYLNPQTRIDVSSLR